VALFESRAARLAAIALAREKLALRPVYLDTETTGLDPRSEIVEIAVLDHDGSVLVDTLIKPTGAIPAEATRVHGITNAIVSGAPAWKEAWPQVVAALRDRVVGIYNMDYDRRLMRQTHRQNGMRWSSPKAEFFCIMEAYAQFYGKWDPRRGAYHYQRLDEAGWQCQISLPNSHRARADAELARAVLVCMANSQA
jgi:DNA polymerase-3 subunit epsilon